MVGGGGDEMDRGGKQGGEQKRKKWMTKKRRWREGEHSARTRKCFHGKCSHEEIYTDVHMYTLSNYYIMLIN